MSVYVELQTRKLISSYGGVGSIIETTHGALKIKPFDKWLYFIQLEKGKIELSEEDDIVEDERLKERLNYHFPELKTLVKVPPNYSAIYDGYVPKIKENILNAEYFPKWFYCNKCGKLKHINEWWKGWTNVYKGTTLEQQNNFTPPKCYSCFLQATKNHDRRKFYNLEQVRFILTAPNGEVKDIPWEQWTNITKEKDEDGTVKMKLNGKCCNKQDLRYLKSDKYTDFSGVRIVCENPKCESKGKQVSLSGLFGLRLFCDMVIDKDGNNVLDNNGNTLRFCFKPVIRTSNSVYYPLITNSLYLPLIEKLSPKIKAMAKDLRKKLNMPIDEIAKTLGVANEDILELFSPQEFISEIEYRFREYLFLITEESSNDDNLIFEVEKNEKLENYGINKILKINRLKLTSVQTAFTRQEPIDKDLFAEYSIDDFIPTSRHAVKAKYTSTKGNKIEVIPAIESFGEGVFIEFSNKKIYDWYHQVEENKNFKERLDIIINNANNLGTYLSTEKRKMIADRMYLSKFILLHTFSHVIIKEFEFLVGYPATSLSERLYINGDGMQGVLIYTIAGSEGSFGGLVSQSSTERLVTITNSALERAKDCASDPICYNSDGQGIGGLNLAACYSCTLLPETSCEEFNSFLDRAILIDDEYGFFKNNWLG